MKNVTAGVKWSRWLFGFEVMLSPHRDDPFGQYGVIGLYVGPFYAFARWRR